MEFALSNMSLARSALLRRLYITVKTSFSCVGGEVGRSENTFEMLSGREEVEEASILWMAEGATLD